MMRAGRLAGAMAMMRGVELGGPIARLIVC